MRLIEVSNPNFIGEIAQLDEVSASLARPDAFGWSEAVKPSVWQAYSGIEVAKEAVLALEQAETPEEYLRAKALAELAIDELRKAVVLAEGATTSAETKATEMIGAAEAIGDPGVMDIVRGAVAKVKVGASKVIATAKSAASKVAETVKNVAAKAKATGSAMIEKAKSMLGTAKANMAFTSAQKAAAEAATTGGSKGVSKCPRSAKTLTPEQAKYGAQEYERWTGKKITPEEYTAMVRPAKAPEEVAPAEGKPSVVERAKAWFWDRWHDVNQKLHQAFNAIMGAEALWSRCQSLMNRLNALAPAVKDEAWLAKYERLKARWIVLDREFSGRKDEYNLTAQVCKEQQDAELKAGKPLSGTIGEIGQPIPWQAIVAIGIASGILAWKIVTAKWERDARMAEAEAEAKLAEAQKAAYDTEKEKTEVAQTGIETRSQEIDQLEKDYQAAVEAGDKEKADAILAEIDKKRSEISLLEERATEPLTTVIPVTPAAAAAEEKPAEASWLERIFGIKPGTIMTAAMVILFIWAFTKLAPPTVKAIKEIKKA